MSEINSGLLNIAKESNLSENLHKEKHIQDIKVLNLSHLDTGRREIINLNSKVNIFKTK